MTNRTGPAVMRPPGALLVLSGRASGVVISIPAGGLLLGRGADLIGQLGDDAGLSRRHAQLATDDAGQMTLEDLGSTNGTFLNGVRVTSRQPVYVNDTVEVGGSRLRLLDVASGSDVSAHAPQGSSGYDEPLSSAWAAYEPVPQTPPAPVQPPPIQPPLGRTPGAATSGRGSRRIPHEDVAPTQRDVRPPQLTGRGKAAVEGQIRGIQQRTEVEGSISVWTFRIERYDSDGNRLPPIAAQLRAVTFDGSLSDGDEARVIGTWKDGTLHATRVENLTTHATVRVKSYAKVTLISVVVAVIIMCGLATGAFFFQRHADQDFRQQVEQSDQEFQERSEQSEREFREGRDRAHQEFCQDAKEHGMTPAGC
jgi:hypothetical protein